MKFRHVVKYAENFQKQIGILLRFPNPGPGENLNCFEIKTEPTYFNYVLPVYVIEL
jgi:hypothetical protein